MLIDNYTYLKKLYSEDTSFFSECIMSVHYFANVPIYSALRVTKHWGYDYHDDEDDYYYYTVLG